MKKLLILAALSTSTFGLMANAALADYTLNILHINDWHSRIEGNNAFESTCSQEEKDKGECIGGAARLVTAVRDRRAALQGENVIFLNAGDNFQGSLFYATYKGSVETEFSNLMEVDAFTLGNHEFDDGEAALSPLLETAQFPILSSNVKATDQVKGHEKLLPSTVLDVGGQKIGVIGVTTMETPEIAAPGPNITFEPEVAAIEREVKALTDQGVNKIIALTHVGYVMDRDTIAKIPGIDVVVGGHSHTLLSNSDDKAEGPYPTMVDNPDGYKVPVVQAASYSKLLGDLKVTFDDNGVVTAVTGDPLPLDNKIAEDPQVLERVAALGAPIEELKNKQVGEFTAAVDGSRETCRAMECAMGNLITDAMLDRTRDQGVTIAIQNGGGIRASIDAGPVTMGEVLTVLPFQNTLATFRLSGQDLKDSLEAGLSEIEEGKGKFPQVAGLRYSFDKTAPANGGRLKSVEVRDGDGWKPLDTAATYTIATNNFTRGGGDGYKLFAENAQDAYDFGPSLEQVVADYITANSPLTAENDGRITEVAAATTAEPAVTGEPAQSEPAVSESATGADAAAPAVETEVAADSQTTEQQAVDATTGEATGQPAETGTDAGIPDLPAQSSMIANEPPTVEPETAAPAETAPATTTAAPEQQAAASTTEPAATTAASGERTHRVVRGDTLWDLAETYYGRGSDWQRIVDANSGLRANRLPVGTELAIPAAN